MPHGYCTECRAQVTVRAGLCLLDHRIDPTTIVDTPGRRLKAGARRGLLRRLTSSVPSPPSPPTPAARLSVAEGAVAVLERERDATRLPVPVGAPPPVDRPALGDDTLSITRFLVEDLWNLSPDEDIDDWTPSGMDETLVRTGLRSKLIVAIAVLVVAAGFVTWRALTWESSRLETVAAAIDTATAELDEALAGADTVVADLADGLVDDGLAASSTLGRIDGAARSLFTLAGDLPESADAGPIRDAALTDATAALDFESTLSSVVAYASAVDLIARPITLPTSVDLSGLEQTTEELTAWVTDFRSSVEALPSDDLTDTHREALREMSASVPDWQADYLDSLRARDPERAQALVDQLDTQIAFIRSSWQGTAGSIAEWAEQRLAALRA